MDIHGTTIVRFRSAVAGFHKGDVTNYIAQTVSAHREAVKSLNDRIDALEKENERLRNAADCAGEYPQQEDCSEQVEALLEENGLLKNRVRQLEYKLEEALEKEAAEEPKDENLWEKELEAYRRAEAMERRVALRTQEITRQLDVITDQSSERLHCAMESARAVLSAIEAQLSVLQETSEDLDTAMAEGLEQIKSVAVIADAED